MAYIMTGQELADRCVEVANCYKTIYMYACYGFQVTDATIKQKAAQNLNGWYTQKKIKMLQLVANENPPTWGFDCVNLIKGILWGWTGDESKVHGGAVYEANGIPDTNANGMIGRCSGVSTDFSDIEVGEAVWMEGHIGVYIGNGLAVECTPSWANGVQITAVHNIARQSGYNGRTWTKHGKLPKIDYGSGESEDMPDYAMGSRTLKKGCQGEDVKELQQALITLGYDLGTWGADGDFGSDTQLAVMAFQKDYHLDADGIVGKKTLEALKGALANAGEAEPEKTYTVVIRGLSAAEKDGLVAVWPESEVREE